MLRLGNDLPVIQPNISGAVFNKLPKMRTAEQFEETLRVSGVGELPFDGTILQGDESPLAKSMTLGKRGVGNRWVVNAMEGWDQNRDGTLSEAGIRRMHRLGESGAKLCWSEAYALDPRWRANPQQFFNLAGSDTSKAMLEIARNTVFGAHRARFGDAAGNDFEYVLQLTHSGRWCKPNDNSKWEPIVAYRHPLLDAVVGIDNDSRVLTDGGVHEIRDRFIQVAREAHDAGFTTVDVKCCHGYLLHEFLSAFSREGHYGGSFENRTRLLTEIIQGIRSEVPDLNVVVRLSVFDTLPYTPDPSRAQHGQLGPGTPREWKGGRYPAFGANPEDPSQVDLTETIELVKHLYNLGVGAVNVTAGSPYYNSHIQRPAVKPPFGAYQAPEPQLLGTYRQLLACRALKIAVPAMTIIGSAMTPFMEFMPHVGQALVRGGRVEELNFVPWLDGIGIGRMFLAYHNFPADCLENGALDPTKPLCRMLSECTTNVRLTDEETGMPGRSGCLPYDDYYEPDRERMRALLAKNQGNS